MNDLSSPTSLRTPSCFFRKGSQSSVTYARIRDEPEFLEDRLAIEDLWCRYRCLADAHFLEDAQKHFHQRFWEMYLGCTLLERGFNLTRVSGEGLEYYFLLNGRRIWIEAVAPEAGNGQNKVPEFQTTDDFAQVPVNSIILRITSAVAAKLDVYRTAVRKGLVAPDEAFLLAINPRAIPGWPLKAEIPYFVKALLPFGAYAFELDGNSSHTLKTFHVERSTLLNSAGSPVSTATLLNESSRPMTAVLHSCVDPLNRGGSLGSDFYLLHNPNASFALSEERFRWTSQFFYSDGRLALLPRCDPS